jgi:hypothetical protein
MVDLPIPEEYPKIVFDGITYPRWTTSPRGMVAVVPNPRPILEIEPFRFRARGGCDWVEGELDEATGEFKIPKWVKERWDG